MAASDGASTGSSLPASSTRKFEGTLAAAMPLAPYRLSAEDASTVGYALALLKQRCMTRFGFKLELPPQDPSRVAANDRVDQARVYGITDPAVARIYGYGFPPDYQPAANPGGGNLSQAELFVLTGNRNGDLNPAVAAQPTSPGNIQGQQIPVGGCIGEAQRAIGDVAGSNTTTLGDQLAAQAGYKAVADPQYLQAVTDWVSCMRSSGYNRTRPTDFPASTTGQPAPAAEIQEALADITCKKSTNYVARFSSLHVKYEQQLLEANQVALSQEQSRLQAIIRKSAAVVSGNASATS